jgi:hypothetical protein
LTPDTGNKEGSPVNPWSVAIAVLAVPVGAAALYGLHRLALWLEARGHLYYKHKRPDGGGGGFRAFQEFVDPPARNVWQVKEERRRQDEEDEGAGPA